MKQDNIIQKVWSLCNILRGDGITYYQYVSELSYLLFLKIAEENGTETLIPEGARWAMITKTIMTVLVFAVSVITLAAEYAA